MRRKEVGALRGLFWCAVYAAAVHPAAHARADSPDGQCACQVCTTQPRPGICVSAAQEVTAPAGVALPGTLRPCSS